MLARGTIAALLFGLWIASPAGAQQAQPQVAVDPQWRSPRTADTRTGAAPQPGPQQPAAQQPAAPSPGPGNQSGQAAPLRPLDSPPRETIARVTKGPGTLPNADGQVWREYDITPYTSRVTSTIKPEQAVVDWVLRETGHETWHGTPLGILSADRRTLRVYHTPEVHAVVAELVDRFVNTEAENHAFGVNVITVGHPNWRAKAHRMLHPIAVESQGVQAWIVAKEDAALLLADLSKRSDYRIHSSPHLLINNGQSNVVSAIQPRTYIRDVIPRPDVWPGFEMEVGQVDEGFSLQMSPLLSVDGNTIDVVLDCQIDQVEKLVSVMIDVPTPVAQRQRAKIEVPRLTHVRLREQFRWPEDHVLLVGLGVVATPVPQQRDPIRGALPFLDTPPRADLLVFVDGKGELKPATSTTSRSAQRGTGSYSGRY